MYGDPQVMRVQGCVQREIRASKMYAVFVHGAVQSSLNCALRLDAKQMQSGIERSDWSMQRKMGFRYNGCTTMQSK